MKISTSKVFASALVAIMFSVFSTSNSKAAEALKIGPAEISFNADYMSQYLWRGIDQNRNNGSASFGVDATLPYGIYLGSWTAAVDSVGYNGSSQELDFYGGIAKSFGMATVDVGYIAYTYPGHTDNVATNFGEFYGKLNLAPENSPLSFDIAYYELDTKPDAALGQGEYIEYGVTYAAPSDISLAVSYGDFEKSNTVTTVSAGKSFAGIDFTLAYIDTNYDTAGTPDKEFLTLTVGKSF
jgi:conserved hypothetical protein, proteobacterial